MDLLTYYSLKAYAAITSSIEMRSERLPVRVAHPRDEPADAMLDVCATVAAAYLALFVEYSGMPAAGSLFTSGISSSPSGSKDLASVKSSLAAPAGPTVDLAIPFFFLRETYILGRGFLGGWLLIYYSSILGSITSFTSSPCELALIYGICGANRLLLTDYTSCSYFLLYSSDELV